MLEDAWTGEFYFLGHAVHKMKPKVPHRRQARPVSQPAFRRPAAAWAVARAVIANPKLILADEPTGNLHSSQGREIMELFKRLNDEGTTIVQVTHSEANAAYGHRIINLADGWVVKATA
jgi:ABC-type histidine transport system ATPase subunit